LETTHTTKLQNKSYNVYNHNVLFLILYYNMCIFFDGLSELYIFYMKIVTLKKGIVVVKRKIVNVEKWVVSTQII